MIFPVGKRSLLLFSTLTPTSRTSGEPTVEKNESTNSVFSIAPTWNSLPDAIKEQHYPVRSYEDKYIKWTMLQQGRDQDVSKFTNVFIAFTRSWVSRIMRKKMLLKYHDFLHRYI